MPVRHAVRRLIRGMDLRLHPCSVAPAEGHEKCRPNRPTRRGSSCNNAPVRGGRVPHFSSSDLAASARRPERSQLGVARRAGPSIPLSANNSAVRPGFRSSSSNCKRNQRPTQDDRECPGMPPGSEAPAPSATVRASARLLRNLGERARLPDVVAPPHGRLPFSAASATDRTQGGSGACRALRPGTPQALFPRALRNRTHRSHTFRALAQRREYSPFPSHRIQAVKSASNHFGSPIRPGSIGSPSMYRIGTCVFVTRL